MAVEIKRGYCTLCRSRCGTLNWVDGDRLIKVEPDNDHPTGSAICVKGRAAPEIVHSPNRLLFPMRRTTPKNATDPGWKRISWQEALDTIASRMASIKAESGAEAVVFGVTTPSGTPMSDSIDWVERFIRAFQSPNICYGTEVCNWHKDHAHAFTFGCGMPTADYANAQLILLWGHNPTSTWLSQATAIGKGRASGARMIVVDPRKTPLAADADVWLQVRPGTDIIVALGLTRLLLDSGGFDQHFVRHWTNAPVLVRSDNGQLLRAVDCVELATRHSNLRGEDLVIWDDCQGAPIRFSPDEATSLSPNSDTALSARHDIRLAGGSTVTCESVFSLLWRNCEHVTPEVVERNAGVSAEALKEAAKLLGSCRPVAYHSWTGIGQHRNATQTERALAILYALTGSFDAPGGNRRFSSPAARNINGQDLIGPDQLNKALGIAQRPLGPPSQGWVTAHDFYRAVVEGNPYQVRAFFGFGTNLLVSQGDVEKGIAAYQQLEFHVHCDLFETPTSRFADIILPVNSPWEREALRVGFEINEDAAQHVQLRPKAVSPQGESRSDIDIVLALAQRLGMQHHFFDGSIDAGWNWMLEPLGLTVDQLRQNPEGRHVSVNQTPHQHAEVSNGRLQGFPTRSKKVELYSETLLNHGYSPLPQADCVADQSSSSGTYPYLLTSVKNGYYCHSQHRSLVSLRKRSPLPGAQLGLELAASKDIVDGDWVIIETEHGRARFFASLVNDLADDVIVAEFGWWQACHELGREGYAVSGEATSNFNRLITARESDPISGSLPMRSFRCDIYRDPEQNRKRRPWQGLRPFKIDAIQHEAEGVVTIDLVTLDGSLLPDYLPGQHITLAIDTDRSPPLTRAYSLTSAARVEDRTHYCIAVRYQRGVDEAGQEIQGHMSHYLHHQAKVGEQVHVGTPGGTFVLPLVLPQPIVIFAAGIGITPFLGYLETLLNQAEMPDIWLHYVNRNRHEHAFSKRLSEIQQRLPRLQIINYYTRPTPGDIKRVHYNDDRRPSAAVVPKTLIERRARFYLCGSATMMATITDELVKRGVPRFDIFSELFRSPVEIPKDRYRRHRVVFAASKGRTADWTASSGTLLQLADSLGLKLPSGCRVGQCESCAVRIISGQVQHLNEQHPEDSDICLTCQAIPLSDVELDA